MKRLEVLKTYKIYIGGKFPRSESGRYFKLNDSKGNLIANVCQCSRKDFRDSVSAARKAFDSWSGKTAFNRSQILYRIAEMMEGRKAQFIDEMMLMGYTKSKAVEELELCIDRFIHYSGWCDKFQQIFGTVNPVSTSHFNFSVPEPTGIVAIIADNKSALAGLCTGIASAIAGGNSCIVLASEKYPISAVTLAEVLNSSDLPGGVVNILTGFQSELAEQFASHMDVNAVVLQNVSNELSSMVKMKSASNVKRVYVHNENFLSEKVNSPYLIIELQEVKTTWHPITQTGTSGSGY